MSRYIGGLKFAIKGKASKQEVLSKIACFLDKVEQECGIENFHGVSLYFQGNKDTERQVFLAKSKENNEFTKIDQYSITSIDDGIERVKDDEGNTLLKFNKNFDFNEIENRLQQQRDSVNDENKIHLSSISVKNYQSLIEEERRQEEIRWELYQKQRREEKAERDRVTKEKEKRENEIKSNFIQKIMKERNITDENFDEIITSYNFIDEQKKVKRFLTNEQKENIGDKTEFLRVTFRNPDTKKAGEIQIYDTDFNYVGGKMS